MPTVDSTQLIKDLREKTGAGMMDCKRALDESKGNYDAALVILRKKGMADAAKKSSRVTKEGAVAFKIDGKVGAIVELNSETDFVAKGPDFQALVKSVVEKATAGQLKSVESAATAQARVFFSMFATSLSFLNDGTRPSYRFKNTFSAYWKAGF